MNGTAVQMLPIAKIAPDPDNERGDVGDVTELAASIKEVGLLEAITVRPEGKGYLVVFGHRRLAGVKLAGLQLVPAIVRDDLTAEQRTIARLVENLHREDLTPLQEAVGYQRLLELGLSQRKAADRVGRSQAHVSKRLALLGLSAKAREKLLSGGISLEEAATLGGAEAAVQDVVLADRWGYGAMAQRVKTAAEDVATTRHVEKLRKAGGKVFEIERSGQVKGLEWGAWATVAGGKGTNNRSYIYIAPKEHAKLPCHGVAVGRGGHEVPICLEPLTHLAPEVRKQEERYNTDSTRNAAKTRTENKQRAEAAKARREFVLKALSQPDLAFAAAQALANWRVDDTRRACDYLELVAEKGRYGSPNYQQTLASFAAKSQANALRALMALALGIGEEAVTSQYGGRDGATERHMGLLMRAGYKPSAADRKYAPKAKAEEGAGGPAPSDDSRKAASSSTGGHVGGPVLATINEAGPESLVELGTAAERAELERRAKIDEARRQLEEAEIVTPAPRDPKACRICGCHGDCEGGCTWIEVDPVAGLLCDSHPAPVPA